MHLPDRLRRQGQLSLLRQLNPSHLLDRLHLPLLLVLPVRQLLPDLLRQPNLVVRLLLQLLVGR
jgi:hypothetical protein